MDRRADCEWGASRRFCCGGASCSRWWLREGRAPAILTAGSAGDARVIYGDERLETRHGDRFNGLRLTLGTWLTSEPGLAVDKLLLLRDGGGLDPFFPDPRLCRIARRRRAESDDRPAAVPGSIPADQRRLVSQPRRARLPSPPGPDGRARPL